MAQTASCHVTSLQGVLLLAACECRQPTVQCAVGVWNEHTYCSQTLLLDAQLREVNPHEPLPSCGTNQLTDKEWLKHYKQVCEQTVSAKACHVKTPTNTTYFAPTYLALEVRPMGAQSPSNELCAPDDPTSEHYYHFPPRASHMLTSRLGGSIAGYGSSSGACILVSQSRTLTTDTCVLRRLEDGWREASWARGARQMRV